MIQQLEQLAADECAAWFELSYEEQEVFSKEYAAYVDKNPAETEAYLLKQPVEYMSVTNIAFESVSCFSNHPEVLLPTVKKILDYAYGKEEFDLWKLDTLDYIETIEFWEKQPDVYMRYMDLLSSYLRPEKDPEYLIVLLNSFKLAFIAPYDPSHKQYFRKKWFDNVIDLANYGPFKVKLAARKVIKDSEQDLDADLIPLTFIERVKKIFNR